MREPREALVLLLRVTRSRLTDERALSKWQLMLVHSVFLRWLARPLLPKGWAAGSFQTAGQVDAQRVALQKLGTRLAALGIASFLCKCASSAAAYFGRGRIEQSESVVFLVTVLTVQAVPCSLTLLLLHRYQFGGGSSGHGSITQALLPNDGAATAGVSQGSESAFLLSMNHGEHIDELVAKLDGR